MLRERLPDGRSHPPLSCRLPQMPSDHPFQHIRTISTKPLLQPSTQPTRLRSAKPGEGPVPRTADVMSGSPAAVQPSRFAEVTFREETGHSHSSLGTLHSRVMSVESVKSHTEELQTLGVRGFSISTRPRTCCHKQIEVQINS